VQDMISADRTFVHIVFRIYIAMASLKRSDINLSQILKQSEANIQKAILDYGKIKGIPMRRMNVIGTPTKDGFRPSPNKGMADIHCEFFVAGLPISLWLEIKNKRGKLSQSQCNFRDDVNSYGGFYFVVRSIEDVEKALLEIKERIKNSLNLRIAQKRSW